MRAVPGLLVVCIVAVSVTWVSASAVYTGPLRGLVTTSKFNFSHESDWTSSNALIKNVVKNDHQEPLVLYWPEAGITAPEERPIPPGKSDFNGSPCAADVLRRNDNAQLFYGLSQTPKGAAVYSTQQPATKDARLTSTITASTNDKPFDLTIVSDRSSGKVSYTFTLNRQFYFALPLTVQETAFESKNVRIKSDAFAIVKFGKLPLKETVPTFGAYRLFEVANLKATASIFGENFRVARFLVFIVDVDRRVVASGYATLHVP